MFYPSDRAGYVRDEADSALYDVLPAAFVAHFCGSNKERITDACDIPGGKGTPDGQPPRRPVLAAPPQSQEQPVTRLPLQKHPTARRRRGGGREGLTPVQNAGKAACRRFSCHRDNDSSGGHSQPDKSGKKDTGPLPQEAMGAAEKPRNPPKAVNKHGQLMAYP